MLKKLFYFGNILGDFKNIIQHQAESIKPESTKCPALRNCNDLIGTQRLFINNNVCHKSLDILHDCENKVCHFVTFI